MLKGRVWMVAIVTSWLLILMKFAIPGTDAPLVRNGFVVKHGSEMPLVLHDGSWPLKAIVGYLEDGYRLAVAPGYATPDAPFKAVWLFGSVAESAHRFHGARIIAVDPPEFCRLPEGAEVRK